MGTRKTWTYHVSIFVEEFYLLLHLDYPSLIPVQELKLFSLKIKKKCLSNCVDVCPRSLSMVCITVVELIYSLGNTI